MCICNELQQTHSSTGYANLVSDGFVPREPTFSRSVYNLFSSLLHTLTACLFPCVLIDRKVKDKIGAKIAGTTSAVSSGSFCNLTLVFKGAMNVCRVTNPKPTYAFFFLLFCLFSVDE